MYILYYCSPIQFNYIKTIYIKSVIDSVFFLLWLFSEITTIFISTCCCDCFLNIHFNCSTWLKTHKQITRTALKKKKNSITYCKSLWQYKYCINFRIPNACMVMYRWNYARTNWWWINKHTCIIYIEHTIEKLNVHNETENTNVQQ